MMDLILMKVKPLKTLEALRSAIRATICGLLPHGTENM